MDVENNLYCQSSQVKKTQWFWYCCTPKSACHHNHLIYLSSTTVLPSQALFPLLQWWSWQQSPVPISPLQQGKCGGVLAGFLCAPSLSVIAKQCREELSYLSLCSTWLSTSALLFQHMEVDNFMGSLKWSLLPGSRSCCTLLLALGLLISETCQHELQKVSCQGKSTSNFEKHS